MKHTAKQYYYAEKNILLILNVLLDDMSKFLVHNNIKLYVRIFGR